MLKYILSLVMILAFSGCSLVYSDIKQAYVDAKVIYQDAKFVVYEISDELEDLKAEKDAKGVSEEKK